MKITDAISMLEHIKKEHGNLDVCARVTDDYWGYIDSDEPTITVAEQVQPKGPKSAEYIKAVILTV